MKKVLIIAYFFPPRSEVGSQRPYRLAKYFTKYGWEPIVMTVKRPGKPPEGIRIIETDYKDILKETKLIPAIVPYVVALDLVTIPYPSYPSSFRILST